MKKYVCLAAAFVALLPVLPSCKPSEKNYREAYELAHKRERANLDDDIFARLQTDDMPALRVIGSDSIYVAPREALLILWQPGSTNTSVTTAPPYNLVVGEYRNPANARAHALSFMPAVDEKKRKKPRKGEAVKADSVPADWDWYPMVLVRGADEIFYVAIAHSDSLAGLLPTQRRFLDRGLRTVGREVPVARTRR